MQPRADSAKTCKKPAKDFVEDEARLRSYLLFILARRDYSRHQITRKILARGHTAAVAARALEKLEQEGFFSEQRFAQKRGRDLLSKGYAEKSVVGKMKFERVEISPETLSEQARDMEISADLQIKKILKRVFRVSDGVEVGTLDFERLKNRFLRQAVSKGHRFNEVFRIFSAFVKTRESDGSHDPKIF